jgi:hypothetical protein
VLAMRFAVYKVAPQPGSACGVQWLANGTQLALNSARKAQPLMIWRTCSRAAKPAPAPVKKSVGA